MVNRVTGGHAWPPVEVMIFSQFDMECLGVVSFCIVPITTPHIQCLIDRVSEWLVAGPRHDGMPCDRWSRWQTVRWMDAVVIRVTGGHAWPP